MSQPPLPPLDPALSSMLEAERKRAVPQGAQAEVFSKLEALLGPTGGGGGGHAPAGESSSHGASALPARLGARVILTRASPVIALACAAGIGVGAWGEARLAPAPQTVAPAASTPFAISVPYEPPPPEPSSSAASSPPLAAVSAAPQASAVVRGIPSAHLQTASAVPSTSARSTELAAERVLLDTARMGLARGDSGACLDALARHEKQFPRGQLVEEREALTVQALAAAGRLPEAGERAARFRSHFPGSVFLPIVDSALRPASP